MSVLKIKDQNNDWIQIPTIKGDKGDPFTYADFTPEQLESLKGKDGISPTVSVASDTSDDYRLSFTDETHTVTTPNLIPEAEKIFDVYPTDTASGAVVSFPDGADDIPLKSCIVQVEPVQEGSGDPSPDNVRPISGFTGVKVQRTGKNLYPILIGADMFANNGGASHSNDNGKLIINTVSTSSASGIYLAFNAEMKRIIYTYDAPLTVSMDIEASASGSVRAVFCGIQNLFTITNSKQRVSITAMEKAQTNFNIYGVNNGATLTVSNLQIELGSTATDYEPFQGEIYTIIFPTEAGTIYGGYVDVINGELVVDRAMVDLGTLTWRFNQASLGGFDTSEIASLVAGGNNAVCSMYPNLGAPMTVGNVTAHDVFFRINKKADGTAETGNFGLGTLFIKDTAYTDTATFKSAMSGVQLCYELATPIHYPLTPTEIKTLLGQNNLWANTGDTEVTYRADTTLYISRLTEPDADMVADANITSGSYFMVGNDLYRATVNIASGAQVIEGTNATKVSLATALNEINA